MSRDLFAHVVDGLAESVVAGPAISQGAGATRSAVEDAVAGHLKGGEALNFVQVMKHTRHAGAFADRSTVDCTSWPDKRRQDATVFFALCGDVADRVAWYLSPRPVM